MKRVKCLLKRVLIILAVIFAWNITYAQIENTPPEVDSFSVHGNYSIGEAFYGDEEGKEDSLKNEKICPYIIEIMTGRTEPSIQLKAFVYADSTADFVQLEVIKDWYKNLKYDLRDVDGRSIFSAKIQENKTRIDFSNFLGSCYFLVVSDEANVTIKTFKIVKNI